MGHDQGSDLPPQLAGIIDDFQAMTEPDRLQLLLEFSRNLPELPAHVAAHRDVMEPVAECQSPLFVLASVDRRPGGTVKLYFDAPKEAPTTRGFASILREGLEGLTPEQILAVPDDVPNRLGLTRAVSPLRLNGMAGMLHRIKRQVREKAAGTV
jgi:cysteine desulfuration protein SufE